MTANVDFHKNVGEVQGQQRDGPLGHSQSWNWALTLPGPTRSQHPCSAQDTQLGAATSVSISGYLYASQRELPKLVPRSLRREQPQLFPPGWTLGPTLYHQIQQAWAKQ